MLVKILCSDLTCDAERKSETLRRPCVADGAYISLYPRRRNVAAHVAEELKTVTYATPPMEERRKKKKKEKKTSILGSTGDNDMCPCGGMAWMTVEH